MTVAATQAEAPGVTVVISGALRALWATRHAAGRESAPVEPPAKPQRQTAGTAIRHRVRRDGNRPLVFEGSALAGRRLSERADFGEPLTLELSIYRTGVGELIGSASAVLRQGGPLESVHHAQRVGSAEEFRAFMDGFRDALGDVLASVEGMVLRDARQAAQVLVARLSTGLTNRSIYQDNEDNHDFHD